MAQDAGDYRLDEVVFGPAEQRLIRRYHRMLTTAAEGLPVEAEHFYFAAASATECLRTGRDDALLLLAAGASQREVTIGRAIARADARFYLDLAFDWIAEASRRAA